jgi:hypothetical protein
MGITFHFDLTFVTTDPQTLVSENEPRFLTKIFQIFNSPAVGLGATESEVGGYLGKYAKFYADLGFSGGLLVRYLLLSHSQFSSRQRVYVVWSSIIPAPF